MECEELFLSRSFSGLGNKSKPNGLSIATGIVSLASKIFGSGGFKYSGKLKDGTRFDQNNAQRVAQQIANKNTQLKAEVEALKRAKRNLTLQVNGMSGLDDVPFSGFLSDFMKKVDGVKEWVADMNAAITENEKLEAERDKLKREVDGLEDQIFQIQLQAQNRQKTAIQQAAVQQSSSGGSLLAQSNQVQAGIGGGGNNTLLIIAGTVLIGSLVWYVFDNSSGYIDSMGSIEVR